MESAPAGADSDLNLQILRRLDPEVDEVLATAGHVCLYYMHVSTQQWTRKNVEGSLFLLKRRKAPRFQMMVLNKLATENYLENIHGSFDFEVNPPYLMYTHGNAEIHGIWFYEQDDLNRLSTLLNRVKSGLPKTDILPAAAPGAEQAPVPAGDGAFWDKQVNVAANQVPAKPDMQPPPQPHAPPEAAQNLTNLLKQAHLKQQSQHVPAPPPAVAHGEAPQLLPPSFFHGQQQPTGAPSVSLPGPAPPPAPPAPPSAAQDNALHKLFAKAANVAPAPQHAPTPQPAPPASQGPVPIAALLASSAKKKVQQAAPAPAPQQPDPLSKLFGSAAAASRAPAQAPPPPPAARQAHVQGAVRDKVRQAFSKLLANDVFVDMVSEEFRAAGLISE